MKSFIYNIIKNKNSGTEDKIPLKITQAWMHTINFKQQGVLKILHLHFYKAILFKFKTV